MFDLATARLPAVEWDGFALNDERADGTSLIVQNLQGWYGTADANVGDVDRALVDGTLWGPKVLRGRDLTLDGVVVGGTRATVVEVHDAIAARAGAHNPAVMSVSDPRLAFATQAEVRATSRLTQQWNGPLAFTYSVSLRAADPRRYSTDLHEAALEGSRYGAQRIYPRVHPWRYENVDLTGVGATLVNDGNVGAPVLITYVGGLGQSELTDGNTAINLYRVQPDDLITVNSATLEARTGDGRSAARYLLPGTRPLLVPPHGQALWRLFVASGPAGGRAVLHWRSAWL